MIIGYVFQSTASYLFPSHLVDDCESWLIQNLKPCTLFNIILLF
uniref:Uncharacterized protein n=1 Tax=Arundo donax TaxID=35708 RepID=A0A0A8Z1T1_ARUDO